MNPREVDEVTLKPPDSVTFPSLKEPSSSQRTWKTIVSWMLLIVGLGFTVVIAITGAQGQALPALTAVMLTAASGIFQVMSVVIGTGASKLDAGYVRVLVRRLMSIQKQVSESRQLAEEGFQRSRGDDRHRYGKLSVSLSYMEDHVAESVEAWKDFSPGIFKKESEYEKRGQDRREGRSNS